MCQLVTTTLQIFRQQGRSSKRSDQFFLTSAQSPAMRTTQQHARGSVRASTEHLTFMAPVLYHARWPILSLQPPTPTNDTPITYFNRAILPHIFFEEAPNVLQSTQLYSGDINPIAFQNSWRMYQIKQKFSHADVPKSAKGHPGSFYDSNFRQVEPSRSGRVHGQRSSPASTYKAAQAWSKTYQTCGAGTTMQSLDHGVQQSTLTYVPQPNSRIPRRDSGEETKKDAL